MSKPAQFFLLLLGIALAVYWPGLSGPLVFDDHQNLAPLKDWLAGLRTRGGRQAGPALVLALESLRKADCVDPAIDVSLFPRTESNWYWSSSAEPGDQFDYWYLDFKDGVKEQDDKNLASFVRFVRTYKK